MEGTGLSRQTMSQPQTEFDSPWKDVIERYFEDFIQIFLPQAHGEIEWSWGFEFLDKELQQVVRDASLGRRLADKLVKVWRTGGEEAWVLIHVEIPESGRNQQRLRGCMCTTTESMTVINAQSPV